MRRVLHIPQTVLNFILFLLDILVPRYVEDTVLIYVPDDDRQDQTILALGRYEQYTADELDDLRFQYGELKIAEVKTFNLFGLTLRPELLVETIRPISSGA